MQAKVIAITFVVPFAVLMAMWTRMTHYHQAAVFTPKVVARASFGQIQEQHWSAKPATFMYIYIYQTCMHAHTYGWPHSIAAMTTLKGTYFSYSSGNQKADNKNNSIRFVRISRRNHHVKQRHNQGSNGGSGLTILTTRPTGG